MSDMPDAEAAAILREHLERCVSDLIVHAIPERGARNFRLHAAMQVAIDVLDACSAVDLEVLRKEWNGACSDGRYGAMLRGGGLLWLAVERMKTRGRHDRNQK